jgi:uncharacterized protein YndB with AHSA1/START domain
MPVKKDANGRRYVEQQVEVPGTPEEVWNAIATGPGISSWFVPTEGEAKLGGTMTSHFAPGASMDSVARITQWEPPHRFVAGTDEEPGSVATEWTVEARAGGTCVVRVVHRWFATTDDWDTQYEQTEFGWIVFFNILRLRLKHFAGQKCTAFQLMGVTDTDKAAAWVELISPLGLQRATEGARVRSSPGAPTFGGVVESAQPAEYPGFLVRLDEPAPGLAHVFALPMGKTLFPVRLFFYGSSAASVAPREEKAWQAWMKKVMPLVE